MDGWKVRDCIGPLFHVSMRALARPHCTPKQKRGPMSTESVVAFLSNLDSEERSG